MAPLYDLNEFDWAQSSKRKTWALGNGMWPTFWSLGGTLDDIYHSAEDWCSQLNGIKTGWLIWNAHPQWCYAQQKIVRDLGWTPIVGGDPRLQKPPLIDESRWIDFNRVLRIPYMGPMFPVEFVFLWIEKLAFFHSDLILRYSDFRDISTKFSAVRNGATCATSTFRIGRFWRRPPRAWELIGCTTSGASQSQYNVGAGWWGNISEHPNCTSEKEKAARENLYWDHGTGILYWKQKYAGNLSLIPLRRVAYGHFSPASKPKKFFRLSDDREGRRLKDQIDHNTSLEAACKEVGLDYTYLMSGLINSR